MAVSREERIKAEAYKRWEKEGRPHGQHDRHWREAAEAVDMPEAARQLESEGTTQALKAPRAATAKAPAAAKTPPAAAEKPKRAKAKKAAE
jgi:hypothetical protein